MKLEMDLAIGEEDTVSGSLVFAVEKAVLAQNQTRSAPDLINDALAGVGAMPTGSRTETYEDNKYFGRKVIFDRMPLAEFNRKDGKGPQIIHSGGLYTFTMNGDTTTFDLGTGPQVNAVRSLLNDTEVRISLTFPGRVIERDNLATLDGQTVSWRLKMGTGHQFKAVSEEPATFPWLLVAGVSAVFAILVIVGIVVLATRLNRRPRPIAEPMLTPVVQHVD
jgi:hypothetical protein